MPEKVRTAYNHPEFGKFLRREIALLHIDREDFRKACHMKHPYLEAIKKGSIIMR